MMSFGLVMVSVLSGCGRSTSYQSFVTNPNQLQELFRQCLEKQPGRSQHVQACRLIDKVRDPEKLQEAVYHPQRFGRSILSIQSQLAFHRACGDQPKAGCATTTEAQQAQIAELERQLEQRYATLKLINLLIGR